MPAELLASGRAADVFAAGPGRVLRRYREGEGGDTAVEALVMDHARRHGYPVPEVYESNGRDLVMERLDGPTMLADIARRPWRVARHGATLAELHRRLGEIPAPTELERAPFGRGDRLAHFDLHPENVLLSARGPMVIDWSNASRGDPADEAALTWVILSTSVVPGPLPFRALAKAGRDLLVNAFLAGVDAEAARERMPAAARLRLDTDPHLLDRERAALAEMIEGATVEQT
jgi:aminoglycoside phosphotransferase (APT) family kinase protein